MKTLLLCCVMMLASVVVTAQGSFQNKRVEILPSSELKITGDTNINKFECNFDATCLQDAKKISYNASDSQIKFENARLILQNVNFDCGNKPINKDFHALLQTEKYPEIFLDLKRVSLLNDGTVKAEVRITIAGKSKDYVLPVEISEGKNQHIKGRLQLNINDFGLQPPKKLFGAIVVKEDIEINFNLTVKN